MNGVQTWGEAITLSLVTLSQKMIENLPTLIGAILVFVAGWIVAVVFGHIVSKALRVVQLDKVAEKMGLGGRLTDMGMKEDISGFIGALVKWFLVLVFLMAAADILKLTQVTGFLNSIVMYLPNVVVAVVILSVVFIFGNFVFRVVKGSTAAAGVMSATLLATISKWAIILFGIFAALIQLGIASQLVSTIFIGIVAMLSLAGGLAFGLGGKDEAAKVLRDLREEMTGK